MGKNDSEQGKVWEDAIRGYLQRERAELIEPENMRCLTRLLLRETRLLC